MGEKLRIETFKKVLKLPLKWFNQSPARTVLKICQIIKVDPTIVQTLLTNFYSIVIKNFASLVAGIIIAFVF